MESVERKLTNSDSAFLHKIKSFLWKFQRKKSKSYSITKPSESIILFTINPLDPSSPDLLIPPE